MKRLNRAARGHLIGLCADELKWRPREEKYPAPSMPSRRVAKRIESLLPGTGAVDYYALATLAAERAVLELPHAPVGLQTTRALELFKRLAPEWFKEVKP